MKIKDIARKKKTFMKVILNEEQLVRLTSKLIGEQKQKLYKILRKKK